MGADRERRVFVSLYGPGTSNGCHMAKQNGRKEEEEGEKKKRKRSLQTCAEFNENTEEIKRNGQFLLREKTKTKNNH